MSRDTRLDEALERMEKVAASAFDTNDLMSDRVIARRVSDKRVFLAARRAIEGLFEEVAEERETYRRAWNRADEELVNLRAASLSVSPVPPDCAKCGHPRSEHHVGQGWCLHGDLAEDATVYEPRIAEELAKQLAPAAVSPVPEPSEPQKSAGTCPNCGQYVPDPTLCQHRISE